MTLRIIPYLVMDGNAAEAIPFYEQALGAEVKFRQTFGEQPDAPADLPPEHAARISHATLQIGASTVMIRDTDPDQSHATGTHMTLAISTYDLDEAKGMFAALEEGGRVEVPMQETFFSPGYGRVTDKFGVPFQIATQIKQ